MDKKGFSVTISNELVIVENNTDKDLIISRIPIKPKRSLEDLVTIPPYNFKTYERGILDLNEVCCRLSKKGKK